MRQESSPFPEEERHPPFPSKFRMKEGPSLFACCGERNGRHRNRGMTPPFPCSGFTGLPPRFFSVHIKSMPPGTEFSGGKGSPYRYGAKKHNKQKVHLQGIHRPPHHAEAAAVNPCYCTRIVCSISSFRRGAVMPPTISFSFIPSRYRTVRGTASRPYLRAMSG